MEYKGIDVSKWNGEIDWRKVRNAGINFAIIREGYGKESPNQIDKKFEENYNGAKNSGVNVGVYHYSYANSSNNAIKEAEFCLKNIRDKQIDYPVIFDIEDKEQLKLNNRQRTDIIRAFCNEIENAGYYAMFYCNLNWLNNYLIKDELLSKYDLWLAQWNCNKPYNSCGIWQYSSCGKIDGISGNVNMDISYKNYSVIIENKGLNGISDLNSKSYSIYTVKKGDTLWKIAKEYLGNGTKYKEIKILNNLKSDTIYVGQILKIPN